MYKHIIGAAATAALVVGLAPATAHAADEEPTPYCQTGPATNRFGAPNFMYEINWGAQSRFEQQGSIKSADLGGAPEILWNGQPASYPGSDHLYLRYDDGGVTGQWGSHANTPTDGTRINYTFPDGTEWTADVSTGKHGCEPQVKWTNELLPFEPEPEPEPEPEVKRPDASATAVQVKPRVGRTVITGTQQGGTQATKLGAYYRVIKFNPRTQKSAGQVSNGRVHGGEKDVVRVDFPKAQKPYQVRVISYGKVIARQRVTMK